MNYCSPHFTPHVPLNPKGSWRLASTPRFAWCSIFWAAAVLAAHVTLPISPQLHRHLRQHHHPIGPHAVSVPYCITSTNSPLSLSGPHLGTLYNNSALVSTGKMPAEHGTLSIMQGPGEGKAEMEALPHGASWLWSQPLQSGGAGCLTLSPHPYLPALRADWAA